MCKVFFTWFHALFMTLCIVYACRTDCHLPVHLFFMSQCVFLLEFTHMIISTVFFPKFKFSDIVLKQSCLLKVCWVKVNWQVCVVSLWFWAREREQTSVKPWMSANKVLLNNTKTWPYFSNIQCRVYHIVVYHQVGVYYILVVYHDHNFIEKWTSGICRVRKLYLI